MTTSASPDRPQPDPSLREDTRARSLAMLRTLVGRDDAEFHEGQFDAISALVDDRRRALVVQRTGWGKSAVYFVATLLLRQRGSGPTILVSPLLALMRDQITAAARAGVRAVAINSTNAHEWGDVQRMLAADEIDVLLLSPERLNNPAFRDTQLPELVQRTGLLVIDEAHCISDWGHDFRPDYRRLRELIGRLPAGIPVLATTATANSRVVTDVAEQLGGSPRPDLQAVITRADTAPSPDSPSERDEHGVTSQPPVIASVVTIRGPLARASLRLGVLRLPDARTRLAWLLSHLDQLPGSGIIYTLTVSAAEDTARLLREAGHAVRAYTGQTDTGEREESERMLKADEIKALVATSALGMGFDKPNLGFVLHLGAPSSPVAYYQQVGRAGRATDNADVLLLPGPEDVAIWQYFATASMPSRERATAVLDALTEAGSALSTVALEARVDIRRTPLELLLKVLDVDGAVQRVQGGWRATGAGWSYDAERYDRIAAERMAEQQHMLDFETTEICRMEFLQRSLDDETAAPCGRCDNCAGAWYPASIDETDAAAASAALDRVGVAVEPRAQWPSGVDRLGVSVRGRIAEGERMVQGRALARLTDLGWGGALRAMFAPGTADAPVSGTMLAACLRVLGEWPWQARPVAIVAIPSRSRPQLIDSLARGIANAGRLTFLGSLEPHNGGPTGGPGGNSAYRLAGVASAFAVPPALASQLAALDGPVLLVDDLADSRWTLTVAARLLLQNGAPGVMPFVLALRS